MEYADFDYYQNRFHGNTIAAESDFIRASTESAAILDRILFGKVPTENQMIPIQNAFCAVAEIVNLQQNAAVSRVSGESVGNHSVSYALRTDQELETEKKRRIRLYLAGTGLLYGGMR